MTGKPEKPDEIRAMFQRASSFMEELMEENRRLRQELGRVETENREFAERYVQIEEHSETLQNLYVASHRLHATLDPSEVLAVIREIVINLVGAEVFGIWMLDEGTPPALALLAGEGLDEATDLSGVEAQRARSVLAGEAWYAAPDSEADVPRSVGVRPPAAVPSGGPLAVVPLKAGPSSVGVLVIRGLLGHKKRLTDLDRNILDLLSGQAATALTSSRLYTEKSRKLETMQAFIEFIKKG